MRFATVRYGDQQRVAVESQTEPLTLEFLPDRFTSVLDVINAGEDLPKPVQRVDPEEVRYLAPVPRPHRNILCVGKNYLAHSDEFAKSGFDASTTDPSVRPEFPIVFSKFGSSVVGPGETVDLMAHVTSKVDYEAELGVFIGMEGRDIAVEDAMEYVWGYTAINDVTARDRQKRHKQWLLGKTLDGFCPMGPRAITRDDLDLSDTQVTCHVNDEIRQSANTKDLIFSVPEIISIISEGFTLHAGDLIATGTPAGVGIGFDPPRFLKPGDCVRIEVGNLGVLENTFR